MSDKLHNITIGELVEVKGILKKPMKEAIPLIKEFCENHGIEWIPDGQKVCSLAKKICL